MIPALSVTIPTERLEALARDVIAEALPLELVRSLRRELLLTVMTVTSEEGGILLGVTPRHFRELCERVGIPLEPLGHKTPRVRILALSLKLSELSIAARADRQLLEVRLGQLAAECLARIDSLSSPRKTLALPARAA